jgi:hypothetical protein
MESRCPAVTGDVRDLQGNRDRVSGTNGHEAARGVPPMFREVIQP